MMASAPIVVGVDGTPGSGRAVRWAAREAARTGAPLVAVYVHPRGDPAGRVPGTDRGEQHRVLRDRALRWVLAALACVDADIRLRVEVHEGAPGPALVRAASSARLLVLGATEEQKRDGGPVGAVASYCRDNAGCRTVVVDLVDGDQRGATARRRPGPRLDVVS